MPMEEAVDGRPHAEPGAAEIGPAKAEDLEPLIGRAVLPLVREFVAVFGRRRHRRTAKPAARPISIPFLSGSSS